MLCRIVEFDHVPDVMIRDAGNDHKTYRATEGRDVASQVSQWEK
jgi:hypothetical protein